MNTKWVLAGLAIPATLGAWVGARAETPRPVVPVHVTMAEMRVFAASHSHARMLHEVPRGVLLPSQVVPNSPRPAGDTLPPIAESDRGDVPSPRYAQQLIRSFRAEIGQQAAFDVWPPDTDGAIGPQHAVTLLNSGFAVRNKFGGNVQSQVSLYTFWYKIANPLITTAFDPRIQYDQYTNRWVAVCLNNPDNVDQTGASELLVAVSDSSDPTMGWQQYAFFIHDHGHFGGWMDFPSLGVDINNIIVAGNMFGYGAPFIHSDVYIFDKTPLLSGQPVTQGVEYAVHHNPCGANGASYQSCHAYDGQPDPSLPNVRNYLLSSGWNDPSGTQRFLRIDRINGIGGTATIDCGGLLPVPCYNVNIASALQASACYPIDAGDSLLTSNAVLRVDTNGAAHLWLAHTVGVVGANCPDLNEPASRAEVAWYEINPALPYSLAQAGRVSGTFSLSYYYPSIAASRDGCVLLGFSGSAPGLYGSAFYTTRQPTDPPNAMQPVSSLKYGISPYRKTDWLGRNRWGDYSATCVDPTDDTTLWTLQEYAEQDLPQFGHCTQDSSIWGTWWGAVRCAPDPLCPCPGYIRLIIWPFDGRTVNAVDGEQIQPFVTCLLGGTLPSDDRGTLNCNCADMDFSGTIDAFDIPYFVNRLLGVNHPTTDCP